MAKINRSLLPIKAHFFFFMAAMGPILPQVSVFGKQLGIEPRVMGFITSVLPILYVLSKPAVGFLCDYFIHFRKMIFISMIFMMSICFGGFYFMPATLDQRPPFKAVYEIHNYSVVLCDFTNKTFSDRCFHNRQVECQLSDIDQNVSVATKASGWINAASDLCVTIEDVQFQLEGTCTTQSEFNCLYSTTSFWVFVVLMCLGTIGYNVVNCVSDAICFDMLGKSQEMKYGEQRVWGTIGFGAMAGIAAIAVHTMSEGIVKSFTPALIVMAIFSACDLISVSKLKLPQLSSSESIFKDIAVVLKQKEILMFLVFATLAGIIDSFIIYFMFWYLEELAEHTGHMESIKLIEGLIVAAQCLGGEIIFFMISGKILKRLGYVHCLSLCFFNYSVRLALIASMPNPWWFIPIEGVMQGASYALCYTCIVAYASAVAPPGTSATIQGLVAGMDDGLGFAIGSLIGGNLYQHIGGQKSFACFSIAAFITCVLHIKIRPAQSLKKSKDETVEDAENLKQLMPVIA